MKISTGAAATFTILINSYRVICDRNEEHNGRFLRQVGSQMFSSKIEGMSTYFLVDNRVTHYRVWQIDTFTHSIKATTIESPPNQRKLYNFPEAFCCKYSLWQLTQTGILNSSAHVSCNFYVKLKASLKSITQGQDYVFFSLKT